MHLECEITINPGQITWFVAEIRLEKAAVVSTSWWGLWFGWWLYKPSHWRDMLWEWEWRPEGPWHTWMIRILGFEINWQRRIR